MIINHSSYIELEKKALANNIAFIRSLIDKDTKLSSVVKGNAYGHGIKEIIPALQDLDVDHFSVFSSYEAKMAHQVTSEQSTIMIMGDIPDQDIPWIVAHEIDFFIYNTENIHDFLKEAEKQGKRLNIHIELETGMHRHGLEGEHWNELIEILNQNSDFISLRGICTHLAGAESSANFKRIEEQKKVFKAGVKKFKSAGLVPERLHISNSAGIITYPDNDLDMVRVGILQYGLWPSKESQLTYQMQNNPRLPLQNVLSWRSSVMEIKYVNPGEFIGYGNSFLAERHMKIASIPVGYGYGFSRALSNTGRVLIHGKRLPVVGLVNMNMFLIDATEVEDLKVGDRVTLIGKDGNQEIKVSYFGALSDQLNYELLTRLDKSIPRRFIDE